jgi:DNA-binding protein YbaB
LLDFGTAGDGERGTGVGDLSDAGAFFDPDASREYVRGWQERVRERTERGLGMTERLRQLRVSAKDGKGIVEVTIDSSGVLVDLKLTERIHRVAPEVVDRAILSALGTARKQAAEQAQQIAVQALGAESPTARMIADRMGEQLLRPDAGDR